jgi:hypothetical protein
MQMGHVGAQSDLLGEEVAGFGKAYTGFDGQVEYAPRLGVKPIQRAAGQYLLPDELRIKGTALIAVLTAESKPSDHRLELHLVRHLDGSEHLLRVAKIPIGRADLQTLFDNAVRPPFAEGQGVVARQICQRLVADHVDEVVLSALLGVGQRRSWSGDLAPSSVSKLALYSQPGIGQFFARLAHIAQIQRQFTRRLEATSAFTLCPSRRPRQ